MFVDGRTLESGSVVVSDVCIVGGGAAGITCAMEFLASGLTVVLLEAGGIEYTESSQRFYEGAIVGQRYRDPKLSRLRYFGGSTNHWAGNCSPLSGSDFDERPWVPDSGWPITLSDLERYYVGAQEYCQIGPFRYDAAYWSGLTNETVLQLDNQVVLSRIAQHSPPTRFGAVYAEDLRRSDRVTVYLKVTVTDLNVPKDGKRITTLNSVIPGTVGVRFGARVFILAVGGIENARVLLNSRQFYSNGIGNNHDLVGRFLMDHAVVEGAVFLPNRRLSKLYGTLPYKGGYEISAHLELSDSVLREKELTNVRIPFIPTTPYRVSKGVESLHEIAEDLSELRPPDDFWQHFANLFSDFDMLLEGGSRKIFDRRLFESASERSLFLFETMIEQIPDQSSRVTLSDERDAHGFRKVQLDYRLSNRDRDNIWKCYEIVGAELARAGIGRILLRRDIEERLWDELLSFGDHHIGTTRAHEDPRFGVVDADGLVHGIDNLYVAGSSTFPTSGHVPPTLTIVALSIRLAHHIARLLK